MRIIEVATSAGLATLAIFLILRRYIVKGLTQDQQVEIERVRAEAALEAREEAMRLREEIEEEAKQKVISAKAEAESMRIRSQALSQNRNLVEYEAVQKWDGNLPQYMMGNSVPFLNLSPKKE